MMGGKCLPAYGRQLTAMLRAGEMPTRMVIVTFEWIDAQNRVAKSSTRSSEV